MTCQLVSACRKKKPPGQRLQLSGFQGLCNVVQPLASTKNKIVNILMDEVRLFTHGVLPFPFSAPSILFSGFPVRDSEASISPPLSTYMRGNATYDPHCFQPLYFFHFSAPFFSAFPIRQARLSSHVTPYPLIRAEVQPSLKLFPHVVYIIYTFPMSRGLLFPRPF